MARLPALRSLLLIAIFAIIRLALVAQAYPSTPYFGVYFGRFDRGLGRWGMVVWNGQGLFEFIGRLSHDGAVIRSYPYTSEVDGSGHLRGSGPYIDGKIVYGIVTGEVAASAGDLHVIGGQLDREQGVGVAYSGYWRWPESRSVAIATSVDAVVGPSGTTLVIVKTPDRGEEDGMTVVNQDGTFSLTLPSGTRVSARIDRESGKFDASVSVEGVPVGSEQIARFGRFSNYSTLATLGADQVFTLGFTIADGANKRLLFRAVGSPISTILGGGTYLTNPLLEIERAAERVAGNDDWNGSDPELIRAVAQVGALPLPEGSKDAALIGTFPPGNYKMTVRSAAPGGSGTVLAEIFDLEPNNGSLLNLSTQGRISREAGGFVSGFVISGDQPRTVLVRAVGPMLRSRDLDVTNPLMDPRLEVKTSVGVTVAANDNWSPIDSLLLDATQVVGASRLDPGGKDAALVTTLAPGAYTASVRGADDAGGTVRLEIFDTPVVAPNTKARLAVDAFTVTKTETRNGAFYYQPELRVVETGGIGAATVTWMTFELEGAGAAGVFAWSVFKIVEAGKKLEMIETIDSYGNRDIDFEARTAAKVVSVLITYRDSEGHEDSISALARVNP